MSLLETVKKMDFNPQTDKVNGNSSLPDGTYDVVVKSAQFHAYDSGYECVALALKVLTGDHEGEEEYINFNLDENYKTKNGDMLYQKYPFLLERALKSVQQFAYATETTMEDSDWEDQVSIGEKLNQEAVGKQLLLEVETYTTKNGSTGSNYEFHRYPEDEDLPF